MSGLLAVQYFPDERFSFRFTDHGTYTISRVFLTPAKSDHFIMVTIDQAKVAKADLESTVSAALKKFTDDTGLRVDRMNVNPIVTLGGIVSYYIVDVEVSL